MIEKRKKSLYTKEETKIITNGHQRGCNNLKVTEVSKHTYYQSKTQGNIPNTKKVKEKY